MLISLRYKCYAGQFPCLGRRLIIMHILQTRRSDLCSMISIIPSGPRDLYELKELITPLILEVITTLGLILTFHKIRYVCSEPNCSLAFF